MVHGHPLQSAQAHYVASQPTFALDMVVLQSTLSSTLCHFERFERENLGTQIGAVGVCPNNTSSSLNLNQNHEKKTQSHHDVC